MTLPDSIMPVVRVLRRDVPKPKAADLSLIHGVIVLFPRGTCPLGLHPKSTKNSPWEGSEFAGGECDDESVVAFYTWWERFGLAGARKAINYIWIVE